MINKSDILVCAQKLFNEKGYDYVSMREIAGNLNISVGNLTYHYKKKEDIFRALMMNNKLLNFNIDVTTLEELNLMFEEMINSLVNNRFFFINDKLSSADNKFFDTNIKHVSIQKTHLIDAVKKLKELGYFKESINERIINSLISVIMMAHLEWCRELNNTTCYPSVPKDKFIKMHWDLLTPYLTDKGVSCLKNLNFFEK